MLRIANLEEIQTLLRKVPLLVDRLEGHDPGFIPDLKAWMSQVEQVLENNRLAIAGSVAARRALLISTQQGATPPGYNFHKRVSPRKIIEAVAADIIQQIDAQVSQHIQADTNRIQEAEQLALQLVTLASYKGLIPDPTGVSDTVGYLHAIWRAMAADSDILAGTVRLVGLVGPHDALVLIDRNISPDLVSAFQVASP